LCTEAVCSPAAFLLPASCFPAPTPLRLMPHYRFLGAFFPLSAGSLQSPPPADQPSDLPVLRLLLSVCLISCRVVLTPHACSMPAHPGPLLPLSYGISFNAPAFILLSLASISLSSPLPSLVSYPFRCSSFACRPACVVALFPNPPHWLSNEPLPSNHKIPSQFIPSSLLFSCLPAPYRVRQSFGWQVQQAASCWEVGQLQQGWHARSPRAMHGIQKISS